MNTVVEFMNACGARVAAFAPSMLLQSAVLIALLFALDLAQRNRLRATVRYAIWMLALVKLVLPPSLSSPTGAAYWLPAPNAAIHYTPALAAMPAPAPAEKSVNTLFSTGGAAPGATVPALTREAVLFVVWLAGAFGMGIWVAWRLGLVLAVIRRSAEAPEKVQALLESCQRQFGIKRAIGVRCAEVGSPAICGIWRPVIVIPTGLARELNESEMRSVLLHESAHFKRGDLWVNHAQILLQIVYWYNPFLWLANAAIRRVREQAVDEAVLVEMGGEAQVYPAALLHVAKLGLGRPDAALGMMGILKPGQGLTLRIRHIVNRPLPRTAKIGAMGMTAVLLLALVAMPMGFRPISEAAAQQAAVSLSDWSGKQLREPERVKLPGRPASKEAKVDAAALEAKLLLDPEDFSARRDLLIYYGFRDRGAKAKHVLWVIEHHPEFSGNSPEMSLDPNLDRFAYWQGRALWLQNVKKDPDNARILGNAAAYFLIYDRKTAEDLLKKAQALEPRNPAWSERLGQLYKLNAQTDGGTGELGKALAEFERARAQTLPAVPGSPGLADLAQMAVAVGELDKARAYATELLGPGMQWSGGGNAGRALFFGNLVLGRTALREGKLDDAKKYLLEAGKTPGDPALDSFGPNMSLARELLEKGETNTVLEFLGECGKFWPQYAGENKMAKWTAEIKEGKTPDFGANLFY